MRVTTLILVLLCGALAFPREAVADKVKSNQDTKLFARPGERAKVILKVSSGKMMTVLAKDGRWLKVRVSGRTGYVARSTVDLPDEGEVARNTRRRSFVDGRSKTRTFGGDAPDDRIGADAVGEGREDGGEDEEEDEEDDPPAKVAAKPAGKTPPKKGADEDDEEDENPLPKGKTPAKAPTKVAAKEEDDEEEEDEEGDNRKRVKIARKTTMYNEANTKSEAILTATKDTPLFPTGEKSGKFTEVENEEGDLGYILTADIESTGGGEKKVVADKGDDGDDDSGGELTDEAPAVGGSKSSQIDVRIRAGVSFLTQGLRSPGGAAGPPNNYDISTAAMTVALGGGYYRASGKKIYGVETTYDYAKALPGIKVPMGKTTSISLHNLNLRGVFGLDFHKPSGLMLLGRLGFRYSSFQVGKVQSMTENTALLPSEVIMAPMIGAALAMPRLGKKVGLRFSVDVMPLTLSYSQTKNLEDGKSPSAKGAIVGVGFTYKWKSSMDIMATYDLTYQSAKFGDMVMTSARMHPMGGVTRSDLYHAVTAGIVKSF